MRHLALGASLYVPATRTDLATVGAHGLRSLIFCTEDAVAERDLDRALGHLRSALPSLRPGPVGAGPLRFIRVRNPRVLETLLGFDGIANIDGFVIPKATRRSLPDYLAALQGAPRFSLMPTLVEAFDGAELRRLRTLLSRSDVADRILSIRVGGADLMSLLHLRRSSAALIYDTVLGPLMAQLVATFRPAGFNLTAPVYEGLESPDILRAEAERDLDWGFFGKTAVHPSQIPVIEAAYSVRHADYEMARAVLDPAAAAVFRMHDTMCEVATHARWAEGILARAQIYGVRDERQLTLLSAQTG